MSFPTRPTTATLQSSVATALNCTFLAPMLETSGNPVDIINSAAMTGSGDAVVSDGTMGNVRRLRDGYELTAANTNRITAAAGTVCAVLKLPNAGFTNTSAQTGYHLFGNGYNQYWGLYQTIVGGADKLWAFNLDTNEDSVGLTYAANTWIFVAWAHGSGTLRVYVDGSTASVASGNTGTFGTFKIGSASRTATMYLAQVSVHNRELTSGEIASLAANPWQMIEAAAGGGSTLASIFDSSLIKPVARCTNSLIRPSGRFS